MSVQLVQDVLRVGGYLDVVGAVRHPGDAERLARDGLEVLSPQPTGIISCTHRAVGEPQVKSPKPVDGGCQTACGASRFTGSLGVMQKPTLWLRTARFFAESSSVYRANCSKCQWSCPGLESKPIVCPGPADDVPVLPEVLVGLHDRRAVRAEALNV